jgi:hypothetical protein
MGQTSCRKNAQVHVSAGWHPVLPWQTGNRSRFSTVQRVVRSAVLAGRVECVVQSVCFGRAEDHPGNDRRNDQPSPPRRPLAYAASGARTAAAIFSAMTRTESRSVVKPARSGRMPLYSATSLNVTP